MPIAHIKPVLLRCWMLAIMHTLNLFDNQIVTYINLKTSTSTSF